MKSLWAPWRMEYILEHRKTGQCIFCPKEEQSDLERLILHRSSFSLVMLNRYPYAYGHLMVAPTRHVQEISKLNPEEMADILRNLGKSVDILKEAFNPNGFNVGMNLGEEAGAGIPHHIHLHIIPRWRGDTNFMPTMADIRIIPEHLQKTFERLLPFFTA